MTTSVTLLGLGEVGAVLAEDLAGVRLTGWDIALANEKSAAARTAKRFSVVSGVDAHDAVREAGLVISAVTAANDLQAARAVAGGLPAGCWFLDLNSAAPGQKQAAAEVIEAAGGRYVESAVMSPIHPKRLAAPMLLGGPHAAEFADFARPLGFTGMEVYADLVGRAAATKLCRSVVIKGVEALLAESLLAAREWGVEGRVLSSLSNLLPADDWERLAAYMISRSLEHGTRRAEELREAAVTVAGTGVEPVMAEAIARRQDWAAAHRPAGLGEFENRLLPLLDAVRERMSEEDRKGDPE
ncbi:MAG TPA: DUF1932 domain-containing protein [Amycolatopsis sp.]|nr:DUF1932 domain-containing protein [Amycolatopsis sp.]